MFKVQRWDLNPMCCFRMFIYVFFVYAYVCMQYTYIKSNTESASNHVIKGQSKWLTPAGHHINVKVIMLSKEHVGLVQGQLGGHHAAKATVATMGSGTAEPRVRRDQEFLMSKSWTELGGGDEFIMFIFVILVYCFLRHVCPNL